MMVETSTNALQLSADWFTWASYISFRKRWFFLGFDYLLVSCWAACCTWAQLSGPEIVFPDQEITSLPTSFNSELSFWDWCLTNGESAFPNTCGLPQVKIPPLSGSFKVADDVWRFGAWWTEVISGKWLQCCLHSSLTRRALCLSGDVWYFGSRALGSFWLRVCIRISSRVFQLVRFLQEKVHPSTVRVAKT